MLRSEAARWMHLICRAVILAGGIVLAGAGFAQPKGDPARGAAQAKACASCHGAAKALSLAGMPFLAGQQQEFLVLQMFLLREGLREVPQMAGMLKDFSDSDLNDVAAHFAGQRPAVNSAGRDPKLHARGAALSQAMGCGSCHMGTYRGQRQIPGIAGQREDYLAASLKAYRDNKRTGIDTSMNGAMYQVPDSDIHALAHYLAHQK